MAPGITENEAVSEIISLITTATKTVDVDADVKDKATNGSTADAAPEVHEVGMECDIKNLYQKEDERGRTTWTDKYPDNLDEAAENELTAKFAILVRNKKSFDSRKKLEIDSIVIQSPLLKTVLSTILKDYPGKFWRHISKYGV
jgi:hypothetical protein